MSDPHAIHPRPARAEDARAVAEILLATRAAFMPYAPSPHPPEAVRAWVAAVLVPSGGVTVAEAGGEVIGLIATERGPDGAWITQMAVTPALVGRGIGAQLLRATLPHLPPPVRLYTFQANHGARRFYEHHGFVAEHFSDGQANEEGCPDVCYRWEGTPEAG